jgi:hypothetical protein
MDADARLDLPGAETALRAAVSVPIKRGEALIGVMTLYRADGNFASVPLDTLEILASTIALAPTVRAGADLTRTRA